MLTYLRTHHVGLLALFLALTDLRDSSASGADLRDGSVSGADVADGGLNGADVANGGLTGQDIRSNSLTDSDVAPNAISADEIRTGAVGSEEVRNGALREEDFAAGVPAPNAVVRFDDFPAAAGVTGGEEIACSAGERAVGGGVSFEGPEDDGDRVTFSEPRAGDSVPNQGATANGWAAGIVNGDAAAQRTARVWVVCVS
jgi:hypothetical protein